MRAQLASARSLGLLVLCTALILAVPSAAQDVPPLDLASAVGMWLFDEGVGDVAKDASGHGNDGSLMVGPEWVDGRFGKALEFNGVDSYVAVDEPVGLPVQWNARTVALWFKWAEVKWKAPGIELMGWGQNVGGARMGVWLRDSHDLGIEVVGPSWVFPWEGDTEWHHLGITFPEIDVLDAKTDRLKLYFDGEPKEGNTAGTPLTRLNTFATPLTIGVLPCTPRLLLQRDHRRGRDLPDGAHPG